MKKGILLIFVFSIFLSSPVTAAQISFLVIESDSFVVNQAIEELGHQESFRVKFFTYQELKADKKAERFIKDSAVIIVDVMMKDLILRYARNIGSWAPGELEKMMKQGNIVQVPMQTYKNWFKGLPEDFRNNVVRQWGTPEESSVMIYKRKFIIPAVIMGNVVLMPEPARGWGDDPIKLYHDPTLYPHHQYIAAYLWLERVFHADAMIHLGTHATHEWLPGKQAGQSPSCPPEVLITTIPNIYPYIVDDVGEGIQAKRRGRGVIIDHLIPALKQSGLYEKYEKLYEMIGNYTQAVSTGSATRQERFNDIVILIRETGILKDLSLSEVNNGNLQKVEHYLLEIKNSLMPYGLHTFGVSPSGEALDETTRAMG